MIYTRFTCTTGYFRWPIKRETVTVYPASQTSRLKSTKKPSQPAKTKCRIAHVYTSPKLNPPLKKGNFYKGDKGRNWIAVIMYCRLDQLAEPSVRSHSKYSLRDVCAARLK